MNPIAKSSQRCRNRDRAVGTKFEVTNVITLNILIIALVYVVLRCNGNKTGTSEEEIIGVLASHSNDQRLQIKEYYKQSFGQVIFTSFNHFNPHKLNQGRAKEKL